MTATSALCRGSRIETTGAGRTASWGRYVGTVLRNRGGSVYVRWDGGFVDDQMTTDEVRPISAVRLGCPCAQCDGKH